jgi:hypothetical protein
VAEGLRRAGIDAISVREVRRDSLPDEDQLLFARDNGRVHVTYNRSDFQRLDAEWRENGRHHEGILWVSERSIPRRDIGGLVAALHRASVEFGTLEDLCLPLTRP